MNNSDLVLFVLLNLKRMKLKVTLTVLGVVVGTTAIVAMVALGVGLQDSLTRQLMSIADVNELTIVPTNPNRGDAFGGREKEIHLTEKLVKEISRIDGVKSVVPSIGVANTDVKIQNHKASQINIDGFSTENPIAVSQGRAPRRDDDKTIILSSKFGNSFEDDHKVMAGELVGKQALIKVSRTADDGSTEVRCVRARIVGIAKDKGAQTDYSTIYMPIGAAEDLWIWQKNTPNLIKKEGYNSLKVTVESPDRADSVQKALEAKGLFVFSLKQILDGFKTVFGILQAILGAIGAVALLVASIGIVNTMIMSIYERTREIGIMKAIGAGNKDIIKIFLGEAGVIGFMGGVGGTFLGWLISKILGAIASVYLKNQGGGESPIAFIVPAWLAIFAIVFATAVGLVSGIYPALRASRLNPLVALRHE
ncbi:MAG: hypothetical protein COW32_06225 [Candidatus Aquicultor secundus]|uniref:ABC transporter permease n=1 Tax=Candidatus Aquicultor secundus TaxID=1973895 RepID=A0A2M7T7M2_9ACTN|nr:FtsX-like permease family protein [Candidatus Aquicultor secundus]OIO87497.1 MAG: hypothetical protein AUK32_03800 [Candidatus Aquicultor secundus]PIU27748.1 MAG: hypothetical protein COT10_01875 [Candidatus Aquicultor secundus]PIW22134.1 MAG: hypothetical protein COW32_06225 [Candidatus Aquicultor secundus]PIX53074.1 MAG: hypothetical protein COZ51_00765 [Candidatus Aquicultor secundus]PIY38319.1 MAG: hypothetical protein COZ03_08460 [Candidatus Aquicultor secundus]